MKNSNFVGNISHLDINVSNYKTSLIFYDKILLPLGWKRTVCTKDFTTYSDGKSVKICICPTHDKFIDQGFHRKRIGLNHLAFYAASKEHVDQYYQDVLLTPLCCKSYTNPCTYKAQAANGSDDTKNSLIGDSHPIKASRKK